MTYEFNNIYCEDSYSAIKNIPDKCIDLIITDPPYLIENTTAGGQMTSLQMERNQYKT